MSRKQVWKVIGLTLLVCGSLYGQQNITSFDVPVSAFSPLPVTPPVNTVPTAINPAGVIVGIVFDASGFPPVYHGFVRSRGGTYTVFDPLGSTNTIVTGITPEGTITGYYTDAPGVNHGFLRAPNGTITTVDDPGAGIGQFQGTFPLGINPAGEITGYYYDTLFASHGFLRTPGGTFATFDPDPQGITFPQAINSKGEIMGLYVSTDTVDFPPPGANQVHFFLRATDGTLTSIDPPGLVLANKTGSAGYGGSSFINNALDGSINPAGSVVGYFFDGSGNQGFLRTPDGIFTPINEPNSANADYTYVNAINPSGTIIGQYVDNTASSTFHGFVRDRKGNQYTTIDGPNSPLPPFSTSATAINPAGEITGWYQDANNFSFHGFVLIP